MYLGFGGPHSFCILPIKVIIGKYIGGVIPWVCITGTYSLQLCLKGVTNNAFGYQALLHNYCAWHPDICNLEGLQTHSQKMMKASICNVPKMEA